MTGNTPQSEAAPGPNSPTAAGPVTDGTERLPPRVIAARPGLVVELSFTLAAATVVLKDGDLYLQHGEQLVVIQGYGPALAAGQAPIVLDSRGDSLRFGPLDIAAGGAVFLTEAPEPPPPLSELAAAAAGPRFGGALLTVFDARPTARLRGFDAVGAENDETDFDRGIAPAPSFTGIALSRAAAPATVVAPFDAVDDNSGVARGGVSGNVITGLGGGADPSSGAKVVEASGLGAPVAVSAAGVDVAGQFGTLHIAADGSVAYQRTIGSVTDLLALLNGAMELFTYTLVNGDGRSDTATLTLRLMPETMASGDATGGADDEALRFGAGASGQLSGLGGEDRLFGGSGSDTLLGGGDNDYLVPDAGNDTVDGGAGDDVLDLAGNLTAADGLAGGGGEDALWLDGNYAAGVVFTATTLTDVERIALAGGNSYKLTLADASNAVTLTVDGKTLTASNVLTLNGASETSAALLAIGGAGNDALTGGGGNDGLDGGAGNDTLTGNAGDDTLTAGSGNDTSAGGAGHDRLMLAGNLTATDKLDGGTDSDTLLLAGNYAAGITFGATTLTNVEAIGLAAGNSYKFTLNNATNGAGLTIDGGVLATGESLTVNGAAETSAALTALGGAGNDVLTGGAGKDTLGGNAGNDTLNGNNADDILIAGSGIDALSGGNGNDRLVLDADLDAADKIDGGANTDTMTLDGDYASGVVFGATTVTAVERIELAAGHDYALTLANATNAAGLTVNGAALGSGDRLTLDGAAETASALNATGGAGDDVLIGGTGSDTLAGGAGDDTLTAGAGTDTLKGDAGDDVLLFAGNLAAADKIDGGADFDVLKLSGAAYANLTLGAATLANVERIELAAGNNYRFTLNDSNNGSSLTIDGAGLLAGQVLTVNGAAETASTLILAGGSGNDALTGGGGADTLSGGLGKDTLTTGAGTDSVDGGDGDDTIVLAANLTAADAIDGGAGTDTVTLSGNYGAGVAFAATTLKNVEAITLAAGNNYMLTLHDTSNSAGLTVTAALAAANALTLDGSAETGAALTVTSGAGADTIIGGGGADVFTPGAGNDTLSGGSGGDKFVLAGNLTAADRIDGGAGQDTLSLSGNYSAGITFAASTLTEVETIALANGNSYKFTLDDANNAAGLTIDGSLLSAGRVLTVNGAAETGASLTATGGAGNDALTGGGGGDQLSGGAGNDTLIGNAGVDLMIGGTGNDKLTGGLDADTFRFSRVDTGKDTIADFKLAEGDVLQFSNVLDGPGGDIQDLIDAGFSAKGVGGNCVISWNGGASTVTLTGVGGAAASLADLATLLGPQLQVTH